MPERYDAYLELVQWDNSYYGFEIAHPKHAWPNYEREEWWWQTTIESATPRTAVFIADFTAPVETSVDAAVGLELSGRRVNAVRLSGEITLTDGVVIEMTPSLNGPKVILLDSALGAEFSVSSGVTAVRVTAELGGGLGSFALRSASRL
jgi:hypothetical protein